ncbi:unnamed protein product [Rangifer tarandus platyrhynchus]|uniref:Uncharacterized protein n=1 Tax=Rangifer tarandus platyrhynchus TaxID=3082113 RepID=A0ABN8Y372_RANTA|nr:unnamed protein product [Rangifer tarandus platyrhynchus]
MRLGGGGRHRDSPPSPQPERSRRWDCPPLPHTSGKSLNIREITPFVCSMHCKYFCWFVHFKIGHGGLLACFRITGKNID